LVTGGAGYVGSHACKALRGAGFLPVTYDNLERGHERLVRWGPLERGDIKERERLADVLRRHRPVAVMHFAAHSLVEESSREPALYYRNNVQGSLTLLEVMREEGIDCLVNSSSAAVYGQATTIPIPEESPPLPVNAYGALRPDRADKAQESNRSPPGCAVRTRGESCSRTAAPNPAPWAFSP